jgi:hypothetical protein
MAKAAHLRAIPVAQMYKTVQGQKASSEQISMKLKFAGCCNVRVIIVDVFKSLVWLITASLPWQAGYETGEVEHAKWQIYSDYRWYRVFRQGIR